MATVTEACTVQYYPGQTLRQVYESRLPELPQPHSFVEVNYGFWSILPDRGQVSPSNYYECREHPGLRAMLCVDKRELSTLRFESLLSLGFPDDWLMEFRYWYTDRSGRGGNRHFYLLEYHYRQYNYPESWLRNMPLYRYVPPDGGRMRIEE